MKFHYPRPDPRYPVGGRPGGNGEKLQRERFLRTLEETRGAWNDKNHPDLKTARDMEKFVGDKRQPYRKRLRGSLKKGV